MGKMSATGELTENIGRTVCLEFGVLDMFNLSWQVKSWWKLVYELLAMMW